MLKALLAGAAVTLAIAAGPALAQSTMKAPSSGPIPMGTPTGAVQEVVPSEPVTPAERAQVRRDWNEMAREWQQRQRSGVVPPQGSIGAPTSGGSAYGGSDPRIAPSRRRSSMPTSGTDLQGLPQEPMTPAERAQVRRDWNEMAREWQQRQRSGTAPPTGTGQPPLPTQR